MNIRLTGTNLIISLKIRRLVNDKFSSKLEQILPQYSQDLKKASLSINRDKKYKNYTLKFDMSLPGSKKPVFAQTTHDDLTAAIVDLREAVEKQIKKYKQDQVNYSLG
ncbi:MAG TPA: HPF/RaiA family ribosome-associated protein [Candidatus Woesebacteria bacterium]|jgi:ribosomal subunit interface protein|nr:HPF/RaiA family ribosome-associated protein [Candidatus Woesebacteria bacterium]